MPTLQAVHRLRYEELRRRAALLPAEVASWRKKVRSERDHQAHYSQLEAIHALVGQLIENADTSLDHLRDILTQPSDRTTTADRQSEFALPASQAAADLRLAQKTWDFFRDKLEQRFSLRFKQFLWTADTVAWNCHRPVIEAAAGVGVGSFDELRAPPLTYLEATPSPATWGRGSYPSDGINRYLGAAALPIPVIMVPWEQTANVWDLLLIPHEVGHNLEADLKLRLPLKKKLRTALRGMGVDPHPQEELWVRWQAEIFADLCGVQLAGPAFIYALMDALSLPEPSVTTDNIEDPHPIPYVRIHLLADYLTTLVPADKPADGDTGFRDAMIHTAQEIQTRWNAMYGPPENHPTLEPLWNDFSTVYAALMDTPIPSLSPIPAADKGVVGAAGTVRALIPYTPGQEQQIANTAAFLATGIGDTSGIAIRHIVSAARLAAETVARQATEAGNTHRANAALQKHFSRIHRKAIGMIDELAPPVLRGSGDAPDPLRFFRSFAATLSEEDLEHRFPPGMAGTEIESSTDDTTPANDRGTRG